MLVREAMTHEAVTVPPQVTTSAALRLLDAHQITSVPVVEDGTLVGIVSEADLLRDLVPADPRTRLGPTELPESSPRRTVRDVMTTQVLTIGPNDDVAVAVETLTTTGAKALPVVDGPAVVGMISRRDVVHLLARADERVEAEIDELFRLDGVQWSVEVRDGQATISGPEGEHERRLAEALARSVPGVVAVQVL